LEQAKFLEAAKNLDAGSVDGDPGSGRPWTVHTMEIVILLVTAC